MRSNSTTCPTSPNRWTTRQPGIHRVWGPTEARARFGTAHDFQGPVRGLPHPVPEFGAGVADIRPEALQHGLRFFSRARINRMPSRSCRSRDALPPPATGPGFPPPNAFAPLYLLARVVASGPPLSVVFTDRLSRTAALGAQGIMDPRPDDLPPPPRKQWDTHGPCSNGLECLQARAVCAIAKRGRAPHRRWGDRHSLQDAC